MSAHGTSSRRAWLLSAALLGLGLACLFQFRVRPVVPDVSEALQSPVFAAVSGTVVTRARERLHTNATSPAWPVDTATATQLDQARDPDLLDEKAHPHPITAEHRAIQRELQLIGALNDALDLRDASAMRALLADHAREFPTDSNDLRVGYALIADCLDGPDPRVLDAAREYYDRERASTLRRYVRRACLE